MSESGAAFLFRPARLLLARTFANHLYLFQLGRLGLGALLELLRLCLLAVLLQCALLGGLLAPLDARRLVRQALPDARHVVVRLDHLGKVVVRPVKLDARREHALPAELHRLQRLVVASDSTKRTSRHRKVIALGIASLAHHGRSGETHKASSREKSSSTFSTVIGLLVTIASVSIQGRRFPFSVYVISVSLAASAPCGEAQAGIRLRCATVRLADAPRQGGPPCAAPC